MKLNKTFNRSLISSGTWHSSEGARSTGEFAGYHAGVQPMQSASLDKRVNQDPVLSVKANDTMFPN